MKYTENMRLNWQTLEAYPIVREISGAMDELYLRDLSCRGEQSPEARKVKIEKMGELFRKNIEHNKELPPKLIENVRKSLKNAKTYADSKKH